MKASLRALLTGVIDYAGLFPPAKLPFDGALANYLKYRESAEAWMLGRFVCPASRLKEIPEGLTLSCSAIGRGGDSPELAAFGLALEADLVDITASPVDVDALEIKVPARYLPAGQGLSGLLTLVARLEPRLPCRGRSSTAGLSDLSTLLAGLGMDKTVSLVVEAPVTDPDDLSRLFGALRESTFYRPTFKLRAGGLEPKAFPSCEQVAEALVACHRAGLPLKATAGLHHPFPRYDAGVGARMHGFVNLFVAGILIHAHRIDAPTARKVLEDENPAHFRFDDDGLSWHGLKATTGQIAEARRDAVLSFGSCSFDEPREDLRALGWL